MANYIDALRGIHPSTESEAVGSSTHARPLYATTSLSPGERRWQQLCNDKGWSEASQILHLEAYLRDRGLFEAFADHADKAAACENGAPATEEFEVTQEDIEQVLHEHVLRVTNTRGRSFKDMAFVLLPEIDCERVARAALNAGDGDAARTTAALAEIKTILVEVGVLEF